VLPGIFYSAEDIETAVAETAHWRLVAFHLSRAGSTSGRHPLLDVPKTGIETEVRPYRLTDHVDGKSMASERDGFHQ
jgi:hypothetical protein